MQSPGIHKRRRYRGRHRRGLLDRLQVQALIVLGVMYVNV